MRSAPDRKLVCQGHTHDVLAVVAATQVLAGDFTLLGGDPTFDQCNLLQTGDPPTLPVLDDLYVLAGFIQRFVRAGVQPSEPAAQVLEPGPALHQVSLVDVSDLQLTTSGGPQGPGNGHHV